MDETFGLLNLSNRKLKASTFDRLNDPFELLGIETSDKAIRAALTKMKTDVAAKFGILCFSKIWSNPVQWGHYANNHQGLCIELELADQNDAYKVNYVTERFDKILIKDPDFPKKLLLSKFKHWVYEEEFRIVRQLSNFDFDGMFYFQPFSDEIRLTKVIIGCQSNLTRTEVQNNLAPQDADVCIIHARSAFKSFNIVEHLNK